jgi:hypothetical protein
MSFSISSLLSVTLALHIQHTSIITADESNLFSYFSLKLYTDVLDSFSSPLQ